MCVLLIASHEKYCDETNCSIELCCDVEKYDLCILARLLFLFFSLIIVISFLGKCIELTLFVRRVTEARLLLVYFCLLWGIDFQFDVFLQLILYPICCVHNYVLKALHKIEKNSSWH